MHHPYERKYDLHSPFTVIQFLSIIVWSSVLHDSALWVWIAKQEHHRYLLNSIHAFPLNCSNLGSASRWLTPKIRLASHLLRVCLNPPFIGRWKGRGWNSYIRCDRRSFQAWNMQHKPHNRKAAADYPWMSTPWRPALDNVYEGLCSQEHCISTHAQNESR